MSVLPERGDGLPPLDKDGDIVMTDAEREVYQSLLLDAQRLYRHVHNTPQHNVSSPSTVAYTALRQLTEALATNKRLEEEVAADEVQEVAIIMALGDAGLPISEPIPGRKNSRFLTTRLRVQKLIERMTNAESELERLSPNTKEGK